MKLFQFKKEPTFMDLFEQELAKVVGELSTCIGNLEVVVNDLHLNQQKQNQEIRDLSNKVERLS